MPSSKPMKKNGRVSPTTKAFLHLMATGMESGRAGERIKGHWGWGSHMASLCRRWGYLDENNRITEKGKGVLCPC